MNAPAPDLTHNTAALLSLPHAVKGKRGFLKRPAAQKRNVLYAFRLKETDAKFIDSYCQKYDMTKTELIQRALQCFTGYNGKNAADLLK
jgi:hypothetical protein